MPLLAAIVLEVIATSALQASQQFTRPWPTAVMALGYLAAFFFLSLALRGIPVGIAYAIWSGLGIVLISAVGWVVFGQKLDMPAIIGLGLILAGVLVVNLFSGTARH
nr:multidrug efflux SMR transporter [Roseomonas marmotae]